MLPIERRQQILSRIREDGKIEIEALARELDVSAMTIRRDLATLEEEGKVMRTHGGAVAPNALIAETPYQNKVTVNTEQKRAVAQLAAEMIPKHAKVLLDSGTTTLEIAKKIKFRDDLLIVTNDIKISLELLDSGSEVICTGGELQRGVGSFLGPHVQHLLQQIHADLLFLGAHAVDRTSGITAPTMEKALVKKMMIAATRQSWIVADSTKFNKQAFAKVCSLEEITGILTDDRLPDADRDIFEQKAMIKYAGSGKER